MEMYDVAIIGTGPAGLEAALTLKNRGKNFILIGDKNLSFKINKAHLIRNYLGLPEINGDDMKNNFLNHLEKMDINITDDSIKQVYSYGDYFALQGTSVIYNARSVIVAIGVDNKNKYKGEDDFLGRGISYCATCDAMLYKNKNIACIVDSKEEYEEVLFLADVVNNILLFKQFDGEIELRDNIKLINDDIIEFKGERKLNSIVTKNDNYQLDGVFILRKSVPTSYLVPGLEFDGAHINVSRKMETNIEGLFAAGDITGTPYQYIKAAGEGNVAALSAVKYLERYRNERN